MKKMIKKINLALISGGVSPEREVSLMGGDEVMAAIDKNKYNITRYDPKTDIKKLVDNAKNIDVAFILLHGPFGEDGRLQGLLDILGIPYQGAGVLGSAVAMNKLAAKKIYDACEIPTPAWAVIEKNNTENALALAGSLGFPLVVKPASEGSSLGMSIIKSLDTLSDALDLAFKHDSTVILEAFIKGRELTVGVLGNEELAALPVVEIIPGEKYEFFDYAAKYQKGATTEICPAKISDEMAQEARELAMAAHRALFLKGYSRTDIMADGTNLFVLETNTIPGMAPTSLLPQAAKAAGMNFGALLDQLIELALE